MPEQIKTLDAVAASVDTVMTKELARLFKFAGCSPTICHACNKAIKIGGIFRLIPHDPMYQFSPPAKPGEMELTDEMCCAKCSDADLTRRDRRELRDRSKGGYSRPSKGGGNA